MKVVPYKAITIRDACSQSLSVLICTGVLFLFVALTYSQITLPRYSTNYTEKDVQQVVNLIITIIASVIGILFSHCRRLTNEAETKTELRDAQLTIPRLHVHFEAASGSKVAMGIPVARNKAVWPLVAFYFLAMMIFAFMHSVLSVIFVIEPIISEKGEPVPVAIPLSIDIPEKYDTCGLSPSYDNTPSCTYSLALQALSSQLVTYQPYTIAGVTFEPPNGTLGLPYRALKHFADEVKSIPFEDARRRYCLPVMDPHVIKCTEVPINHTTCESIDSNFVRFKSLNVSSWNQETNTSKNLGTGLYKITSPFPHNITDYGTFRLVIDGTGNGVMIVQAFEPDYSITLVGGADAWGEHGYATMLHRLMYYGAYPNTSTVPDGATYDFAARCKMTSLINSGNLASSWRQVDFTLESGVLRANVTDEHCPNARAASGQGWSGFGDLPFALDGAAQVISSTDGYARFFNNHPVSGGGSNIFANMSRLDAVVNQVYQLVQTFWTSIGPDDLASEIPRLHEEPIIMTSYPHLFIVRISWTPTTYLGLALAILIALMAWVLAARWVRAVYHFGFGAETWNLLRPVDLMAYSLAASQDLFHPLNTKEHRRMEMRGTTTTTLREHPASLVSLITEVAAQRASSDAFTSTPVDEHEEKAEETVGPGVSVRERNKDLESGT